MPAPTTPFTMTSTITTLPSTVARVLRTEDTGKIFERAICLAYNIPYDGKYKYGLEAPEKLKPRLARLTELFPLPTHTAKRGARYDFTATTDPNLHLSAKTTKGNGKVAPQVIGQPQPQKFCDILGIPFTSIADLKKYIQENIQAILPILLSYTLDCPSIYYNEQTNTIRYVTLASPIPWNNYTYSWTCKWDEWKNTSTVKIVTPEKTIPLVEFQFHTKSRTNMAIRWSFEEFLTLFPQHLNIQTL